MRGFLLFNFDITFRLTNERSRNKIGLVLRTRNNNNTNNNSDDGGTDNDKTKAKTTTTTLQQQQHTSRVSFSLNLLE
jgi:hypothetical protein